MTRHASSSWQPLCARPWTTALFSIACFQTGAVHPYGINITLCGECEGDVPIFTNRGRACLFVHIPKTGGSTVESALTKAGWTKHLSINGVAPEKLSFLRATPQHFHAELLDQFVNYDRLDEIVMIVRDPVSRMKSEFYWQEQWRQTKLVAGSWITEMFDTLEEDAFAFDNHLRPQAEFQPETGNVKVFKLEDNGISKAIETIKSLAPQRPSALSNLKNTKTVGKEKSSKYRDEVELAFAEHAVKIREFYRRDCELFGYST